MADFTDLSVALVNQSFTFFLGTGFSKYMTDGKAPSWLELLVDCAKEIDTTKKLSNQLFNTDNDGNITGSKFELAICAQILELEYLKNRRDIKESVSEIIRARINSTTIDTKKMETFRTFFELHPYVNIITTNYDTILSEYVLPEKSRVFIEDSSISRINNCVNIYHIHGCISKPNSIILTLNDYYRFQNRQNYFSRKFFTLLQETTVAILGYSLGDFNLNTILSEVRFQRKESYRTSDIFYISRNPVEDIYAKFYSYSYGIQVIDNYDIDEIVISLALGYSRAKSIIDNISSLRKVLYEGYEYDDDFLKLSVALNTILIQAASLGIDKSNQEFLKLLIKILNKKKDFTRENGAWAQYAHLADWIITIGSLLFIKGSSFEEEFNEIIKYSLRYCSRRLFFGYSWESFNVWRRRWSELKIENQFYIREIIDSNYSANDEKERRNIYQEDGIIDV